MNKRVKKVLTAILSFVLIFAVLIFALTIGRFSNASPFWNYSWSEAQPSPTLPQDIGLHWILSSGDAYGRHSGYDFNNATARSYARSFAREVDEIASQQIIAISIVSVATAVAIAAAVGGVGIGAVAAAILVLGGVVGSTGYWYAAWSASNRANRDFTRLQPMIYWP